MYMQSSYTIEFFTLILFNTSIRGLTILCMYEVSSGVVGQAEHYALLCRLSDLSLVQARKVDRYCLQRLLDY